MTEEKTPVSEGKATTGNAVAIWKFGTSMASKMVGGMAGVVTTGMTANPFLGVAVGTALAQSLEKVGTHVIDTRLGPRQEVRVGRAITVAAVRMDQRIESGEKVRSDAFFQKNEEGRSDAEKAIESALLAAMNSAEEKKVDFIGALMSSINFDPSITASDAQQLIELAQNLRYRAYVILKIANDVQVFNWQERGGEEVEGPPVSLYPLMTQIYDMSIRGLIEMRDKPEDLDNYAIFGADEIDPTNLSLSPLGRVLYKNMELHRISEDDPTYISTIKDLKNLSRHGKGSTRLDGIFDASKL